MKYMLDTNICIYILKNKNDKLISKFKKCKFSDIAISSIVYSELIYGVKKSSKPEQNMNTLLKFLSSIVIYDYDVNASNEYGDIRCTLEKRGNIIGPMDMLIAAHARSLNAILVTNNRKEFDRVEGLKVEDWVV